MDLINNINETPNEDCSGNKDMRSEKRPIFGLTDETNEDDYLNYEDNNSGRTQDFLQKLHIRNHELNADRYIYEFLNEEIEAAENQTDSLSEEDEYLFNNVGQAIAEQDIIDLRTNLIAISKTISTHQWDFDDIEKYLESDLDAAKYELIQNQSRFDRNLADDIDLYRDIDQAIVEDDIMQLRSELGLIFKTESSHSRTLEEIEDYLSGEMDESSLPSFEEDLTNNHKLSSEVKLSNEINEALGENDVMKLRAALAAIGKDAIEPGNKEMRNMFSLKSKIAIWYSIAATLIILLGIKVISQSYSCTGPQLYRQYYQPDDFSPRTTRSAVNADETMFYLALTKLNMKDYNAALGLFHEILTNDNQNSAANFYSGVIYQHKENYTDAVQSFKRVTEDGDNLFIEQSNWYLGLCYLAMNQKDKAINQFQKVSVGTGFYCRQSKSILEKLR
jgi:hypothetical protein